MLISSIALLSARYSTNIQPMRTYQLPSVRLEFKPDKIVATHPNGTVSSISLIQLDKWVLRQMRAELIPAKNEQQSRGAA